MKSYLSVFILCLISAATAVWAAVPETENAKNRISLSARQGMLSQLIARDVCFVMAGIQPERYADSALSAVRQFDTTLAGLLDGNDNLRINMEQDPAIRSVLSDIETSWFVLRPASQQIASGDLHTVPMGQMLLYGQLILDQSATLAARQVTEYGPQVHPDLATTLRAANRLATYAIKASNEYCLIALDIDRAGRSAALQQTIAAMDDLVISMTRGAPDIGVMRPPDRQMEKQLNRIATVWEQLSAILRTSGETTKTDADQVKLANLSNQILLEVKTVVNMYLYLAL